MGRGSPGSPLLPSAFFPMAPRRCPHRAGLQAGDEAGGGSTTGGTSPQEEQETGETLVWPLPFRQNSRCAHVLGRRGLLRQGDVVPLGHGWGLVVPGDHFLSDLSQNPTWTLETPVGHFLASGATCWNLLELRLTRAHEEPVSRG